VGPILRGRLCGLADGYADAVRHRGARHLRAVPRNRYVAHQLEHRAREAAEARAAREELRRRRGGGP
jgi:hypothetical protein